jgi:hypothetical protein
MTRRVPRSGINVIVSFRKAAPSIRVETGPIEPMIEVFLAPMRFNASETKTQATP